MYSGKHSREKTFTDQKKKGISPRKVSWNAIGGWDNYLNFMDKIFTGASQTTTFSPSNVSRYTVPFQKDVCLTKWCDCTTSYLELNLAIALVIAESHYASGVIVALLLEGILLLYEHNTGWGRGGW